MARTTHSNRQPRRTIPPEYRKVGHTAGNPGALYITIPSSWTSLLEINRGDTLKLKLHKGKIVLTKLPST